VAAVLSAAFDAYSNRLIEQRIPAEKRISRQRGGRRPFACNAVNIGRNLFVNQVSAETARPAHERGFRGGRNAAQRIHEIGGAAKCLTLRLTEPEPLRAKCATTVSKPGAEAGRTFAGFRIARSRARIDVQNGGSFSNPAFQSGENSVRAPQRGHQDLGAFGGSARQNHGADDRAGAVVGPRGEWTPNESGHPGWRCADDFMATTIYPPKC